MAFWPMVPLPIADKMQLNCTIAAFLAVAILPNPKLTPGKANPILTKDVICSPSFRTGPYRNVSQSEKKQVFKEYGIDWSQHSDYEVDHLISLELGGANDISNLWAEAYLPRPGAHEKDKVENLLHKQVCDGKISLQEAQQQISTDWYSIYKANFK